MKTQPEQHTKRNLIIFTVSVLGLAALAGLIEPYTVPPGSAPGTPGLGQLLWILAPLSVALLLRAFGGDGWSDFGLRPNFKGNGFWWLVSIFLYPVILTISALVGSSLGGLALDINLLAGFVSAFLAGLFPALIKNIFEEFAWRGYLAPKLYSLDLNIWLAHGIVGIIWGAWHLPFLYVFWTYLTPDLLWFFVPLFMLGVIGAGIVYGEIRLATGSVLPVWIMHTIGNAFGSALLFSNLIQLRPGQEVWFSPGVEGMVSILLMYTIGVWLHQRRKDKLHGNVGRVALSVS